MKVLQTEIKFGAKIDPSLYRSVGLTKKQIEAVQKTIGGTSSATVKLREEFERAQTAAERFHQSIRRIGETAAGVFGGELLTRGFEKAIGLAEELRDKMKEFSVGSLEAQAHREVLTNQTHSMLASLGRGGMSDPLYNMLRNMEGNETALNFNQLLNASNRLLSASPERFKNPEQIHKMLGMLADVSRDSATFDLAMGSITKMLAEGRVDQQHLREFSVDTGFNLSRPMAKALNMTPQELAEALKKHKISPDDQIKALLQALGFITGSGGPAYGHAKAQLQGLEGEFSRFMASWTEFQVSFGSALEDFVKPLGDAILKDFKPNDLIHTFDQFKPVFHDLSTMGVDVVHIVEKMSGGLKGFNSIGIQTERWLHETFMTPGDSGWILKPELYARTQDSIKATIDYFANMGTEFGKLGGEIQEVQKWCKSWDGWLVSLVHGIGSVCDMMDVWTAKLAAMFGLNFGGGGTPGSYTPSQFTGGREVSGFYGPGSRFTVYGPGVPGDNVPHRGTWDSDSYNHIGHIRGVKYSLEEGDVAMMPEHAAKWYPGLQPGGSFISRYDQKIHRWRDTTGSKNPNNEDVFHDKPIHITMNINGAVDHESFRQIVRDHSGTLADAIGRHLSDHLASNAVV